jgi:hypothetical protein
MMRKKSPGNSGRYSPRAALVAVGLKVNSLKLLEPVKQKVVILQKSIRHTPAQKLQDVFIAILAGAHGFSEINTRVRSDEALQRAFGRGHSLGAPRDDGRRVEISLILLRDT